MPYNNNYFLVLTLCPIYLKGLAGMGLEETYEGQRALITASTTGKRPTFLIS